MEAGSRCAELKWILSRLTTLSFQAVAELLRRAIFNGMVSPRWGRPPKHDFRNGNMALDGRW